MRAVLAILDRAEISSSRRDPYLLWYQRDTPNLLSDTMAVLGVGFEDLFVGSSVSTRVKRLNGFITSRWTYPRITILHPHPYIRKPLLVESRPGCEILKPLFIIKIHYILPKLSYGKLDTYICLIQALRLHPQW